MSNNEEEPKRPYRLWSPLADRFLRGRNYKILKNAHLGALIEARWSTVGVTIEVLDIRTSKLLGLYSRTPTSVVFTKIKGGIDG